MSSMPDSGDFPAIVDPFEYDAEDDLLEGVAAREGDREGVLLPTPCKVFIEALRRKDGVVDLTSTLIELGLRLKGIRGAWAWLPGVGDAEDKCRGRAGDDVFGDF